MKVTVLTKTDKFVTVTNNKFYLHSENPDATVDTEAYLRLRKWMIDRETFEAGLNPINFAKYKLEERATISVPMSIITQHVSDHKRNLNTSIDDLKREISYEAKKVDERRTKSEKDALNEQIKADLRNRDAMRISPSFKF